MDSKFSNEYVHDFIIRSVYNSCALDGCSYSEEDVCKVLYNKYTDGFNELKCMIDLTRAIFNTDDNSITLGLIKNLVLQLSGDSEYRKTDVEFYRPDYSPAPHERISSRMEGLMLLYNEMLYSSDFKRIADFHIMFERIHPFSSMNGFVGRLLLAKMMIDNGYMPIVIPESHRSAYFHCIAENDVRRFSNILEIQHKYECRVMNHCA